MGQRVFENYLKIPFFNKNNRQKEIERRSRPGSDPHDTPLMRGPSRGWQIARLIDRSTGSEEGREGRERSEQYTS